MTKKNMMEFLWYQMLIHTDPNRLPNNPLDTYKITFIIKFGQGEFEKLLRKHLTKEDFVKYEGPIKIKGKKETTLPDQERH